MTDMKTGHGPTWNPPQRMTAMVLHRPGEPLRQEEVAVPVPGPGEVLVRVRACGVCRTDLHLVDGELPDPVLPVIPGHEIVGEVVATGDGGADRFHAGDRVGVPWLGATCGRCRFCLSRRENLCERPQFTGYTRAGGYAQFVAADERYCFRVPDGFSDADAAPLLCAGLIGYRCYRAAGDDVHDLGIYGFGAAAHIVAQLAAFEGRRAFAFTRPGDAHAQAFARTLGAAWAGGSDELPSIELDAAIIFAPVGALVPVALRAVAPGGTVVCGGIHMSEIPAFPYRLLWQERVIRSVANLTRRDGEELLALAAKVPVRTQVQLFPLGAANDALAALRAGDLRGAAVLSVPQADDGAPGTGTGA
jgi:propanol-preferring alcohol dehydrogenase